ncbi:LytR/AlgR family response regulator transcription factor [Undibacterium danionis]|uniref:LytR/AlgR family response regulator transcription factor n=1 Tax=Undibacterium danionis TaxID=1812100 RepID=A0ABV6IDG7_9BURK
MRLRYLIIDDEPIAHTLIRQFADDFGAPDSCELDFVGSVFRASDAADFLEKNQVDLVFLDIQMPGLTGFEFLRTLDKPPYVIIISAHKEYALESYEYAIIDYLLKPFNFSRFAIAVEKVLQDITRVKAMAMQARLKERHQADAKTIFIKDDKKQHQLALDKLIYIKANGNFSSVYHAGGHILSQMKISDFEKLLPKDKFSRVHRSYIVAHHEITLVKANEVVLGGTVIPVGRVYKDHLAKIVGA